MVSKLKELKDFFDCPNYSIAITCCKTDNGRHVGILYKDSQGQVKLLHLAFHHLLRNDVVVLGNPKFYGYKWVEFALLDSSRDPNSERKESIIVLTPCKPGQNL